MRYIREQLAQLGAEFPGCRLGVIYTPDGKGVAAVATMRVPHQPGRLGVVVRQYPPRYGDVRKTLEQLGIIPGYASINPVTSITTSGAARTVWTVPGPRIDAEGL